ncbi:MAG: alpha-L-fucosidase [Planctomycetota bacterium]|nr:alpha-L-fucosidase [Planctomycetota bacterium]
MTHHRLAATASLTILIVLPLLTAYAASPTRTPAAPMPKAGLTREQRIQWWREARFGMFIHWGLYSIPAGVWKDKVHATGYSEWLMFAEKIPAREYELLAGRFNPAKFDAKAWAAIAKKAGMKYMVLTTKHHDGFSMFRSRLTPYNVADATPFKRDVTRELSDACHDSGLRFGCYYSIDRDWYRPQGPGNNYKQNNVWDFPDSKQKDFDRYFEGFAKPQVEELLTNYRPDLLWFDEIDMKSDAQVEDLYQAIRKLRPECVVNSRIQGCRFPKQIPPPHCDYITSGDNEILEKTLGFEWENPGSMNTSYGYNQNDHNWVDAKEIVFRLVDIVSKGGNYLLNVGPTSEGLIPQPSIDRLMEVGAWMETNGEAICGTSPWRIYGEGPLFDKAVAEARGKSKDPAPGAAPDAAVEPSTIDIRFTAKGNSVYAICLTWPEKDVLVRALGSKRVPHKAIAAVSMLGSKDEVKWRQSDDGLTLSVPREKPCRYASVYRIDFKNE